MNEHLNTIIIVDSNHGWRYGPIMDTVSFELHTKMIHELTENSTGNRTNGSKFAIFVNFHSVFDSSKMSSCHGIFGNELKSKNNGI